MNSNIQLAAETIQKADAIFVGTGAGMGVDSGLPDFRGNEGFWKAYPPMKLAGLSFYDLANPVWFSDDPNRAWGFYGHRRNLYRETVPHAGFQILREWFDKKPMGGFVFTSNVDGHFQKAGFDADAIVECHGAIDFDQCIQPCCEDIWDADHAEINVDLDTFRAAEPMPRCRHCCSMARPNILMFGDHAWNDTRTSGQFDNMQRWLISVSQCNLAVVEIGAGTAVPTVRYQCERMARKFGKPLIRINPREPEGANTISVAAGAADSLREIHEIVSK